MSEEWKKKLEEEIEQCGSTYTEWWLIEDILEWLEDFECLTKRGKEFREYIWKKYVKEELE